MAAKGKPDLLRGFNRSKPPSVSEQSSPLSKVDRFALANRFVAANGGTVPNGADRHEHSGATNAHPMEVVVLELDESLSAEYRAWCIANQYKPGQVIDIALTSLKDSPYNPRHFYPLQMVKSMGDALREGGQQQPILVIPDYANVGTFFISDGGSRVRGLRHNGAASAKAIVVDIPIGIQSYKHGFDLNTKRASQTPFDNAMKWRRLIDEGLFATQRELGDALGVDEATVTQTLRLATLPEAVMEEMVLKDGKFGTRMAYQVALYHERNGSDSDATLKLVQRVVAEDLSTREVEKITVALQGENKKPRKTHRTVFNQRILFRLADGGDAGELKTYGDDRLEVTLRGLPKETRDELQQTIERLIKPLQGDSTGVDA